MTDGIADILPLSPLQEGLLFLSSYSSTGVDPYTVQLVVDLSGSLDSGRVRDATRVFFERHPHLKSCFWFEDLDHPVALVPESVDPQWTYRDLGGLPDPSAEAARIAAVGCPVRAGHASAVPVPPSAAGFVGVPAGHHEPPHHVGRVVQRASGA
ncbi:hypothetical protein GCM10029964_069630 [Kibdelosporangium lantanae]